MPYQSRLRNYKSRREKNMMVWRTFRLVLLFFAVLGCFLLLQNRYAVWGWLQSLIH